jgi:hypothetical protein
MASLWAYGPVSFTVNGGDKAAIELKVPRRGTIRSLVVEQLDDGADNGTLQLFDSRDAAVAYLGAGDSSISEAGEGGNSALAHAITSEMNIVAGKLFRVDDMETMYVNRDGTNANPVRRLWGILDTPGAVGRPTFAISMTIEPIDFA